MFILFLDILQFMTTSNLFKVKTQIHLNIIIRIIH